MDPREVVLQLAGVRLVLLEYGAPERRPLLLVHGIRDHAWSLDPIARAFADEFRVLVPHLRGHGDSDRPGAYAMADFLGDLCGLVEGLDLVRPVLVGHSLGGQIVTHYAGIFDDVPAAVVTIEGLGPPERGGTRSASARRAELRERLRGLARGVPPREPLPSLAAALARFRSRNPRLTPERAALLVERGTEPDPQGGLRWKWDPEAQNVWSTVSARDSEERWSWIRCPVLVVTAEESLHYWTARGLSEAIGPARFAADLARKLACFGDCESVIVPGAGHLVHYDQPAALIDCMRDFLDRRL